MATAQYIGARYVPKFFDGAANAEWQPNIVYEPLTIVTWLGSSWTSKKTVPASVGAPNLNSEYWINTGNFNQQVQDFINEVQTVQEQYDDMQTALDTAISNIDDSITDIVNDANTEKSRQDIINNAGGFANVEDWTKFGKLAIPTGTYVNSCYYDIETDIMYVGFVKSDSTESYIKKYTGWSGKQGNTNISESGSITINNNHANSLSCDGTYLYASSWNGNYVTKVPKTAFNTQENITLGFNLRNAIATDKRAFLFPYGQNAVMIGTTPLPLGNDTNIFDTVYYTVPLAQQIAFAQDISFYNNCIYSLLSAGGNAAGAKPYISINSISPQTPIVVPVTDLDYASKEYEAISVNAAGAYLITSDGYIVHSIAMATTYPQIRESAYWQFPKFTTSMIPLNNRRTDGLPYTALDNYYYVNVPAEIIQWAWTVPLLPMYLQVIIPRIKAGLNDTAHQGSTILVPLNNSTFGSAPPRYTISGNTDDGWYIADITIGYSSSAIEGQYCLRVGLNAVAKLTFANNTWTKIVRTDPDFDIEELMPSIVAKIVM